MPVTIADDNLIQELTRAGDPVEVQTPDGRLLGTFSPAGSRGPEPHVPEDELRRLEDPAAGRWYPAAEVEAKLRELRCSR